MGGVIARSIATKNDHKIPIVITLASPHLMPVLDIDPSMHSYYNQIDLLTNHRQTTFVSIAGGDGRDSQVTSSLTRFPGNMTAQNHVIQVESASVPRVHVETDHQCIVWCKQLQLVIARFLYATVDNRNIDITEKSEVRNQVANFYFHRNTGLSNVNFESSKNHQITLKPTHAWKDINSACWASRDYKLKKNSSGTYFTFSINKFLSRNKNEFVARTVLSNDAWILGCSLDSNGQCKYADDLTAKKGILVNFSKVDNYNVVHLDLKKLQHKYTHVVVPVSKFRFMSDLDINIIENREVLTEISTPYLISYFYKFIKPTTVQLIGSDSQCKNRFYRKVSFKNFESMTQVYWATLNSLKQRKYFSRVEVGWDKGAEIYTKSNEVLSKSGNDIIVAVRSNPPSNSDKSVYVHYYTAGKPLKNEKLNLSYNIAGGLFIARLLRHFGSFLVVFTITSALFVLSFQFEQATQRKSLHKIDQAHYVSADLMKIQPWLLLPYHILSKVTSIRSLYDLTKLPLPEIMILESYGMWSILIPITTFFFSLEVFRIFNSLNLFLIHVVRFTLLPLANFVLKIFRVPRSSKISALSLHVTALACLIGFHGFFAFVYCYIVMLFRGARARNEMIKFSSLPVVSDTNSENGETEDDLDEESSTENDPEEEACTDDDQEEEPRTDDNLEDEPSADDKTCFVDSGDATPQDKEGNSKDAVSTNVANNENDSGVNLEDAVSTDVVNNEDNNEVNSENPLQNLNKQPQFKFDETTKSEDVFASIQAVINIFMWLVILTLPSFVAYARDDKITFYESQSLNSLLPAILLVVVFCMTTLRPDVTELSPDVDETQLRYAGKLVKYSPVLMVVYSCISIYRVPYFVLIMMIARYSVHFF